MVGNSSNGYLPCLMCDAEVPVSSEDVDKEVYCSFCQIQMKVRRDEKEDDLYLEEEDWG